jgi:hypothetical protein
MPCLSFADDGARQILFHRLRAIVDAGVEAVSGRSRIGVRVTFPASGLDERSIRTRAVRSFLQAEYDNWGKVIKTLKLH